MKRDPRDRRKDPPVDEEKTATDRALERLEDLRYRQRQKAGIRHAKVEDRWR